MKRSGRLARVSPKRRRLNAVAGPWREQFRQEIARCEACGHSPTNPWPDKPVQCSVLTVHEIQRGNGLRQKALMERFAILCLCWFCNSVEFTDAKKWPVAKQLALLKRVRSNDYVLARFIDLVCPQAKQRYTAGDVAKYADEIEALIRDPGTPQPNWR